MPLIFSGLMLYSLFFELLKVAIQRQTELSRIPSPEEWRDLFVLARQQTLEGVLYAGVERLPVEQQPSKGFMLQWYGLVKQYERLNIKINRRVVEAGEYFSSRGIRHCLLKGQGVATYYPQPLWRIPGDIDLWVEADRKTVYEMDICTDSWLQTTYLHLHSHIFKETDLEIHVKPSWLSSPFLNRKLQSYFRSCWAADCFQRITLPEVEGQVEVPSLEFNHFYLLLHIYHHLFGEGIGLRQLMDYYYVLLQENSAESLERTRVLFRQFHLMKFAGATMFVLQKVFDLPDDKLLVPVNEQEGEFLLHEIMLAGNFGKYDARIDREKYKSTPRRFLLSIHRNFRFLRRYPSEILWDPFFRMWYYSWRVLKTIGL